MRGFIARLALASLLLAVGVSILATRPQAQFTYFYPAAPASGGAATTLLNDATSASAGTDFVANATALTVSHIIDAGLRGNPFLYVAVITYSATLRTTSTVTYNAVSCTKIGAITAAAEANNQETTHWSCVAPTQGTHNIVATFSGQADFSALVAESLTGAAQVSPIDSNNIGQDLGGTTSHTTTTTVVATGTWLVGAAWGRGGASGVTAGAGTTVRVTKPSTPFGEGDSNGTVATGSQSLIFQQGSAGTWPGATIASIKHG